MWVVVTVRGLGVAGVEDRSLGSSRWQTYAVEPRNLLNPLLKRGVPWYAARLVCLPWKEFIG